MMKHPRAALAATLIAAFLPVAGMAQTPQAGAKTVTCPATVDLAYKRIDRLPFEGKTFDIVGFTPRFSAAAPVRLIGAGISPEATLKDGRSSDMADNAETAKPGQPLVFTFWPKEEKTPPYAAFVSCDYEGGYLLQQAVPAMTRSCTLRSTQRKAAATDASTREIYTSAVFTCQ